MCGEAVVSLLKTNCCWWLGSCWNLALKLAWALGGSLASTDWPRCGCWVWGGGDPNSSEDRQLW